MGRNSMDGVDEWHTQSKGKTRVKDCGTTERTKQSRSRRQLPTSANRPGKSQHVVSQSDSESDSSEDTNTETRVASSRSAPPTIADLPPSFNVTKRRHALLKVKTKQTQTNTPANASSLLPSRSLLPLVARPHLFPPPPKHLKRAPSILEFGSQVRRKG